jgi:hypothetical protein
MTNEEVADLVKRIDDLEQSNKALWAWVKALANQDTMILEFAFRLEDRDVDGVLESQKIINHITDNALSLHGLPKEDTNE